MIRSIIQKSCESNPRCGEESEIAKWARKTVDKYYCECEEKGTPFINVAAMMREMVREMKRVQRERESGFVLDNSHRRHG